MVFMWNKIKKDVDDNWNENDAGVGGILLINSNRKHVLLIYCMSICQVS